MALLFHAAVSQHDTSAAWLFLQHLAASANNKIEQSKETGTAPPQLTLKIAVRAFKKAVKESTGGLVGCTFDHVAHLIRHTCAHAVNRRMDLWGCNQGGEASSEGRVWRWREIPWQSSAGVNCFRHFFIMLLDDQCPSIVQFMDQHGLPFPSVSVNGRLMDGTDLQAIMGLVSQDLRTLQTLVASGKINDKSRV